MGTKSKLAKLLSGAALLAGILCLSAQGAFASGDVRVNPAVEYQTMDGWGTSICWWGNTVGTWIGATNAKSIAYGQSLNPPVQNMTVRDALIHMMFSPDGLNMNIARFCVGGGDANNYANTTIRRIEAMVPGWSIDVYGADGSNNGGVIVNGFFEKDIRQMNDYGQLYVLLEAARIRQEYCASRGLPNDFAVEVFANSPPWYMTESGKVTGGVSDRNSGSWENWPYAQPNTTGNTDNLVKDQDMTDFAAYMAAAAKYMNNKLAQYGAKVNMVNPFNEPGTRYWGSDHGGNMYKQEGANVTMGEPQNKMLRKMRAALDAQGLGDTFLTMGETDIGNTINGYNQFAEDVKDLIPLVGTHAYDNESMKVKGSNDINRVYLRDLMDSHDKTLWQVELGQGNGSFITGAMDGARSLARSINRDLKTMETSAWMDWNPMEPLYDSLGISGSGSNLSFSLGGWGLISVNSNSTAYGVEGTKGIAMFGKPAGPFSGQSNSTLFLSGVPRTETLEQNGWGDYAYAVGKSYYGHMQYSKFIKQGYTMVDIGHDYMVAFVAPDQSELVIVANTMNNTNAAGQGGSNSIASISSLDATVDLSAFPGATVAEVYRTTGGSSASSWGDSCARQADQNVSGGSLSVSLSGSQIYTYVIKNGAGGAIYTKNRTNDLVNSEVVYTGDARYSPINKFQYGADAEGAQAWTAATWPIQFPTDPFTLKYFSWENTYRPTYYFHSSRTQTSYTAAEAIAANTAYNAYDHSARRAVADGASVTFRFDGNIAQIWGLLKSADKAANFSVTLDGEVASEILSNSGASGANALLYSTGILFTEGPHTLTITKLGGEGELDIGNAKIGYEHSALYELAKQSAGVNESDYTPESYAALSDALQDAIALMSDDGASESGYTLAEAALQAAFDALAAREEAGWDDPEGERNFTDAEWAAVNYTLYHVNAGANDAAAQLSPTTAAFPGDKLGIYQTRTESAYSGTYGKYGQQWGYTGTTTTAGTTSSADKTVSSRTVSSGTTLTYQFDIPKGGDYFVTVGSKINSGNDRSFSILINDVNVSGSFYASSRYMREKTYKVSVAAGGEAALKVVMQGTGAAYPVISYITVQKAMPVAVLTGAVNDLETALNDSSYTALSIQQATKEYRKTKEIYADNISGGPVTDLATFRLVRGAFSNVASAKALLKTKNPSRVPLTQFTPGAQWFDTDGNIIHAHGMGVIWNETEGKYFWYGENRGAGRGVNCYSSADLLNWDWEGWALRGIPSPDSFDNDPYYNDVYGANLTEAEKTRLFEGARGIRFDAGYQASRNTERPKCVYNAKTGYYVMWMHMEGYTNANGGEAGGYSRAEAGVAVSKDPGGPFRYLRSYRMDICPSDQADSYPEDKGMSRDMNLFVDDDGTGYIIYSSEENRTLYISRLLDDYSDIASWHKSDPTANTLDMNYSGIHTRDAVYNGEYGVDFVRPWPGATREAPAMFKTNNRYWIVDSGATGWQPNEGRYASAPNILGPWDMGKNPFSGLATTPPVYTIPGYSGVTNGTYRDSFNTQPTAVVPMKKGNGETLWVFFGDRWCYNGSTGPSSTFNMATYVPLPIIFDEYGDGDDTLLTIRWLDRWDADNHTAANRPPRVRDIPDQEAYVGETISFTIDAFDLDAADVLTYDISWTPVSKINPALLPSLLPAGSTLNPATGEFSWTPTEDQTGTRLLRVFVSDGKETVEQWVTVKVLSRATALSVGAPLYVEADSVMQTWDSGERGRNYGDNDYLRLRRMPTSNNVNENFGFVGEKYMVTPSGSVDVKMTVLRFTLTEEQKAAEQVVLTMTFAARRYPTGAGLDTLLAAACSPFIEGNGRTQMGTNANGTGIAERVNTVSGALTWANRSGGSNFANFYECVESSPFAVDGIPFTVSNDSVFNAATPIDGTKIYMDVTKFVKAMTGNELNLALVDSNFEETYYVARHNNFNNPNFTEDMVPNLTFKVDMTALREAIARYEGLALNEADCTPETWAVLMDAYEAASLLAGAPKLQSEVDAAAKALNDAMDALETYKEALDRLIARVEESMSDGEFNNYDVTDLNAALNNAKTVSSNETASQDEILGAYYTLKEALENLNNPAALTCAVKSMLAKVAKLQSIPFSWNGGGAPTFKTSNAAVCNVTPDGTLIPMKAGIAVITITAPNGETVVFAVSVSV